MIQLKAQIAGQKFNLANVRLPTRRDVDVDIEVAEANASRRVAARCFLVAGCCLQ